MRQTPDGQVQEGEAIAHNAMGSPIEATVSEQKQATSVTLSTVAPDGKTDPSVGDDAEIPKTTGSASSVAGAAGPVDAGLIDSEMGPEERDELLPTRNAKKQIPGKEAFPADRPTPVEASAQKQGEAGRNLDLRSASIVQQQETALAGKEGNLKSEEIASELAGAKTQKGGNGQAQLTALAGQSASGQSRMVAGQGQQNLTGEAADAMEQAVKEAIKSQNQSGETTLTSESVETGKAAANSSVSSLALAGQVPAPRTENALGRRAEARLREAADAASTSAANASRALNAKSAAAVTAQNLFSAQALGQELASQVAVQGDANPAVGDLPMDRPGLSQLLTEAAFQPGTVHRPETPRMIAMQLAQAFVTKGERNIDVALNPEELGRVKMRVSTSEAGITVVIQAERPETNDLMRRHINELAEEFKQMGFENISFQFGGENAFGSQTGGGESNNSQAPGTSTGTIDDADAALVAEAQVQQLRLGSAGVDMRV
ncbi:flagellar hook-length control protein [Roseobacter sp. SK209-2-6]|nr:flagellar hook-length control protein [Roseobacter sp. SK209-2-6]